MRGLSLIAVAALSWALALNCGTANLLWDDIEALAKAMELQKFCAKNPGHKRCDEIEERQAFCNNYPTHDRCKENAASTVLFWCESADPYILGMCDGTLNWYADQAVTAIPEWKRVPPAVVQNSDQLRRLFIREGHRVPEVLHLPASQLFYYAVTKAFPCMLRPKETIIPK
jgi:hypothetical protein